MGREQRAKCALNLIRSHKLEKMDHMGVELPYPPSEVVRVPGILIDRFGTMDEHFLGHRTKAQVRHGLLARASRTNWGLEIGVLQITHDAIITSVLRFGLVMLDSCFPHDLADKIDTCIANVAARKVCGLDPSV